MTKRALLIAFHFPPEAVSSGIQRTLSFSKHISNYGWEPIVLSASPLAYSVKNSSQLASLPPSLIVKRAFALDTKRHLGISGRYPELLALPDRWVSWWMSGVPSGLSIIRKYKPAVIWSTFPIATSLLIALTLHKITRIPWVVDFRDPMLQRDYPTTVLQRKLYAWIEAQAMKRCHRAVFTTGRALDYYKKRYPKSFHNKFTVIENGYDEDGFSAVEDSIVDSDSPKCGRLTLLHSGMLYTDGRDPSAFFESLAFLKHNGTISEKNLRVVLRATGDDLYFHALIEKHKIRDIVSVAPAVPYLNALKEMLNVDGLVIFQGTQFNNQVPAKIYEYFRARKPIFGLVDVAGETARVLANAGFKNIAMMNSCEAIIPALEKFILEIREGKAHVASDEAVAAASRTNRAAELAQVFNETVGQG